MKNLQIVLFFCFCIAFNGCMPLEEDTMTLSFWTDRELASEEFTLIYANETLIGKFENTLEDPGCADLGLLDLIIDSGEDLQLSVQNETGDAIDIGVINLFSVSTGIKIKPSDRGEIFVSQTIDDLCTLVKINWK